MEIRNPLFPVGIRQASVRRLYEKQALGIVHQEIRRDLQPDSGIQLMAEQGDVYGRTGRYDGLLRISIQRLAEGRRLEIARPDRYMIGAGIDGQRVRTFSEQSIVDGNAIRTGHLQDKLAGIREVRPLGERTVGKMDGQGPRFTGWEQFLTGGEKGGSHQCYRQEKTLFHGTKFFCAKIRRGPGPQTKKQKLNFQATFPIAREPGKKFFYRAFHMQFPIERSNNRMNRYKNTRRTHRCVRPAT